MAKCCYLSLMLCAVASKSILHSKPKESKDINLQNTINIIFFLLVLIQFSNCVKGAQSIYMLTMNEENIFLQLITKNCFMPLLRMEVKAWVWAIIFYNVVECLASYVSSP